MEHKEFEEKRELVVRVIRALQDDVVPIDIKYTSRWKPEEIIEKAVLKNPTEHPSDIYFSPKGHVGLILQLTEGPGTHNTGYNVVYRGANRLLPETVKLGSVDVSLGEVVATFDNRLIGGYAGTYWFSVQEDNSLKYFKWIKHKDDLYSLFF